MFLSLPSPFFFSGDARVAHVHYSYTYLSLWITNRFLYDGNRISEDDTPSSLEMEDNGVYRFVSVVVLSSLSPSISFRLLCLEHTRADPYLSYATDTIDVMVERTSLLARVKLEF